MPLGLLRCQRVAPPRQAAPCSSRRACAPQQRGGCLPSAPAAPALPSRCRYVQRREQVLQLFFFVVLLYQQAVHNFLDSHTSRVGHALPPSFPFAARSFMAEFMVGFFS